MTAVNATKQRSNLSESKIVGINSVIGYRVSSVQEHRLVEHRLLFWPWQGKRKGKRRRGREPELSPTRKGALPVPSIPSFPATVQISSEAKLVKASPMVVQTG